MKIKIIFSSLIVFLLVAGTVFAQPKLEFIGGNVFDWGQVTPKDNPLTGKIKLKNTGTSTLEILRVKPTCGCTTAPLDKNKLAPGETAELDVTFKITGASGNFMKNINIFTNEPNKDVTVIDLKAFIKRPITLNPSTFIPLNNLQVGYTSTGTLSISNTSDINITLSDVVVTPSNASVNLKKSITLKPGEVFNLVLSVRPSNAGSYKSKIEIKSSHPDFPLLTIHAYGAAKASPLFNNR